MLKYNKAEKVYCFTIVTNFQVRKKDTSHKETKFATNTQQTLLAFVCKSLTIKIHLQAANLKRQTVLARL